MDVERLNDGLCAGANLNFRLPNVNENSSIIKDCD